MYAIKYRIKYRSDFKFDDICSVYKYHNLKIAESEFNRYVKLIRNTFKTIINDRYFYARVELIKSDLSPAMLSFTNTYDVEEVYGTYMEKGILKIGYLGG